MEEQSQGGVARYWWVAIVVVALVLLGVWALMERLHPRQSKSNTVGTQTAEQRISVLLPFAAGNEPYGIMPMGETVHHSAPIGHPGIDFFWTKQPQLIASFDGIVQTLSRDGKDESGTGISYWMVDIVSDNGQFEANYGELIDYNTALSVGSKVKQGDYVGHPHNKGIGGKDDFMTHWSFQASNDGELTLCPLTYLDATSLARINAIWANTTTYADKTQFPKICNGVFDGLDSLTAHDSMRNQLGLVNGPSSDSGSTASK